MNRNTYYHLLVREYQETAPEVLDGTRLPAEACVAMSDAGAGAMQDLRIPLAMLLAACLLVAMFYLLI